MSNEAQVRVQLQIKKGTFNFVSNPSSFKNDITNALGPSPGTVTVPVSGSGLDVDLSALTNPGLCVIQNLDDTNYVDIGAWDGSTFIPLFEVGPGEIYPYKISRNLGEEFQSGTGTSGSPVNTLRLKAYVSPVNVNVLAFDR